MVERKDAAHSISGPQYLRSPASSLPYLSLLAPPPPPSSVQHQDGSAAALKERGSHQHQWTISMDNVRTDIVQNRSRWGRSINTRARAAPLKIITSKWVGRRRRGRRKVMTKRVWLSRYSRQFSSKPTQRMRVLDLAASSAAAASCRKRSDAYEDRKVSAPHPPSSHFFAFSAAAFYSAILLLGACFCCCCHHLELAAAAVTLLALPHVQDTTQPT